MRSLMPADPIRYRAVIRQTPSCYQPEATVAAWDSHPLRKRAFPRRTESLGYDRWLKANTVKRRTHSLFRQGLMLYEHIRIGRRSVYVR